MKITFFAPRYWLTWLGLALLWMIVKFPLSLQYRLGGCLGAILYILARRRRHITTVNIALCFPELDKKQQKQLIKDCFKENAIGIFETAFCWWASDERVKPLLEIHGLELLREAQHEGRGVLLLGGHYTMLDLAGRFLCYHVRFSVTYRKHKNPLMDHLILKYRQNRFEDVIERKEIRRAMKRLKQCGIVWYAGDQDYGRKHSVFAPFFGIPAATITASSRLANFNHSRVLCSHYYRKADNSGYVFIISDPFANMESFPSGDDQQDAILCNQILENAIRLHPAQYMWLHRRFKSRPDGNKRFYKDGFRQYL